MALALHVSVMLAGTTVGFRGRKALIGGDASRWKCACTLTTHIERDPLKIALYITYV